jgi:hypothetical protein
MEVVSLVNFDNPKRVSYLDRSFSSFYSFYGNRKSPVRHLVFDSSKTLQTQQRYYDRYAVEVHHHPGMPFGERLKLAMGLVREEYFTFLPDDFAWIFPFPLQEAINECILYDIAELKLTARGMKWYSQPGAQPQAWFRGEQVISGEKLLREGSLYVSRRWLLRDFHEQFSLACNVLQTDFARQIIGKISKNVKSPGQAEKQAYAWLAFRRYAVAYYKMWIPAFHFIDLNVEGDSAQNQKKAETMLVEENFGTYNQHFNGEAAACAAVQLRSGRRKSA